MKDYRVSCLIFSRIYFILLVAYYLCAFLSYFRCGFMSITLFIFEIINKELLVKLLIFEVLQLPVLYAFFKYKIVSIISLTINVIQLGVLIYLFVDGIEKAKIVTERDAIAWPFALFNVIFIILLTYRIIKLPAKFPRRTKEPRGFWSKPSSGGEALLDEFKAGDQDSFSK